MLLVGQQEGHPACKKTEWWGAGVVICLERGADLHMAKLLSLPLTVCCFSKIKIGFTFLVPAHLCSPGQRAIKRVCVCVSIYMPIYVYIQYIYLKYNIWPIVTYVLCVCLLVTTVSCAKTDEPIKMSVGVLTLVADGTVF